ncbi:MAG: PA domain-containing protein [Actinomycetota bacterium]
MKGRHLVFLAALSLVVGMAGPSSAGSNPERARHDRSADTTRDTDEEIFGHYSHQHGPSSGHLPSTKSNVEVLGTAKLTTKADRISDVAVLGDYAYLGVWTAGLPSPQCRGGAYVVDISNPQDPEKVGYLRSHQDTYATEGVHALHVETASFTGDLLVVSNESCGPRGIGGLTLWDVTDPLNPVKLSEDGGDYTDGHFTKPTNVDPVAHDSHSAMAWQAGANAYVIAIDNDEDPNDLDFFRITDPRNPVLIAETGIGDWPSATVNAFGNFPTSHDFDVRFIGGHWLAMISYWDAGWVLLNVDDPSNPTFIDDFDYAPCEAHVPTVCPPEGEAHQGEWNEDGTLFIGTDEDLAPFRLIFDVVGGPAAGGYTAEEFSWTIPISTLPDQRVNGPVVFGGYGCPAGDASEIPPATVLDPVTAPGEDQILMLSRGPVEDPNNPFEACFFSEKVEQAQIAGYDAVIIANHHAGSGAGAQPDATLCGSQGHTFTVTIPGLCVGHRLMHLLFDRTPDYKVPYPLNDPGDLEPNIGDIGNGKIDATSFFSGWGGSRLLDANTLQEIDQFYISEASDPTFAVGFGDVDVHEVATGRGPDANLAYFAHYSGGIRVARFDATGITEIGRFIDQGGNDFWGVQLTDKFVNGRRVVAFSDRDYGLYLASYTGP